MNGLRILGHVTPKKRMSAKSVKAKGRLGQQDVARIIREKLDLPEDDVVSRPMGSPGADIMLSRKALERMPFDIEVKTLAAFVGYKFLDQASRRAGDGREPLAVVKGNRKRWLAVMDFESFMDMVARLPPRSSSPEPSPAPGSEATC